MVLAKDKCATDVDDREAGDHPLLQRLAHAFFYRWDELPRHDPADDFVDEHEPFAARRWLDLEIDHAVLTVAAGLADVSPFGGRLGRDRLAVGHFGHIERDVDTKFSLQALGCDLQV